MSRILVTGACGPAGRSLLDQLSTRGLPALGCDMDPSPRTDGITVLRALPARDPDHLTELVELMATHHVTLLIPTVQEELPLVAASPPPGTLISPLEGIEIAHDKWLTGQHLAAAGVPVPATVRAEQALDSDIAPLGLPVLSKPRVSRGGRGVVLHDAITDVPRQEGMLLSEFAPGTEYCVQVVQGIGNDVCVVLEKTQLRSGLVGNADAVRRVEAPDVAEVATAAVRALGLVGPADLDIRRRDDGTPLVIEVNARFGAQSAHAPELLETVLAWHAASDQDG
ncbi:MAG: ATP-grasp domain-containing protein [Arachnia propionica]|uniref:ATP-grasp domain-containing protein n=1 Tax=Arachnia propionica TaxID=1750 RepID=UPI0026FEDB6E|nr:ATP-grasp domain-containing protein [Arachnia propionica]